MRLRRFTLPLIPFCVAITSSLTQAAGAAPDQAGVEFFEAKVRPVLVEHCYKCHSEASGDKLQSGLRLDTGDGVLKGGESGKPAVVPGNAVQSRLIEAIRYANPDLQMPPDGRLADRHVADLAAWVDMGAPDPRTGGVTTASSPKAHEAAARFWSFQQPVDQAVPAVRNRDWPKTPVDYFILAKLEEKGLAPAPEADRRALIRRATYDLTGLPPTPEEVEQFVNDAAPDAWKKLIDRLLASPRYGERWGRYWLDLARYSDTKGYVYGDREEVQFVHAHAYRDWVIKAFNDDLPYDQFLLQQIAADQLLPEGRMAGVGDAGRGAVNHPSLAAMGFLTIGRRFLGVPYDIIDDRIDVLMRSTQGLSVGCARCHDHKFDPIPTQDYYSLYGVFDATAEKLVPVVAEPQRTKEYDEFEKGLQERVKKLDDTFKAKKDALTDSLRAKAGAYLLATLDPSKLPEELFYVILGTDDINPVIGRQWLAYLFQKGKRHDPVFAPWTALSKLSGLPPDQFAPRAREEANRLLAEHRSGANPLNPVVAGAVEPYAQNPPQSMADVAKLYGELLGGVDTEWRELVKANPAAAALPDGDREALRQVLYGPDSPTNLPPGSIADLSWFFDEGGKVELGKLQSEIDRWIINSPGAPPHALILEDRAVKQNPRVLRRGSPTNKGEEVPRQFLAVLAGPDRKPFERGSGRLELARAIASRDNPLTARVMVNRVWMHHFGAGLVNTPSDFGTRAEPPSHPELLDWLAVRFMNDGWSVKKLHKLVMGSAAYRQGNAAANPTARAADPENRLLWRFEGGRLDFESMRDSLLSVSGELDLAMGGRPADLFGSRRTVYGKVDRQFLPGVFRTFDFANPDIHIPQRPATTVPQQALFLMNNRFVVDRARALGARPDVASLDDPAARVRRLYQLLFQRPPTAAQVEAGVRFVEQAAAAPPPLPPPPPPPSPWKYGYGEVDPATGTLKNFDPLPHFTGKAWQGGEKYPVDGPLGWAQLTAEGGHAGNDIQHAVVRRWVAPKDAMVSIAGTVGHGHEEGDGVRAYVISSRDGGLASWVLHNRKAETRIEPVSVKKGDTIDFVVDLRGALSNDDFGWAVVIRATSTPDGQGVGEEWDAKKQFSPEPAAEVPAPDPWQQYAQVLLLSNEFLFVD